ncbi:MAG: DUF2189 domain-containing protein [Pseudomonadota bacterium]
MTEPLMIDGRQHGAPELSNPDLSVLRQALSAGWRDFMAAPLYGILAGLGSVIAGWALVGITAAAGHTFWLILAVFGFPLIAPFAALGTYEVSRLLEQGIKPTLDQVLRVLWAERLRQLPWLCALMVVALLFWFFLGHMIFALFLGLKPMTNVTSSLEVFLSSDGLMMLGLGTVVGGLFAFLLYSMCVVGLPMLLDREVDYVTAMLRSINVVSANPVPMLIWAAVIAMSMFVAMIPGFLGLIVVLPWLGHASWHLYRLLMRD